MGSIVKSIGKTIKKVVKKVGRFVKKNAPYILLAAALWIGLGAYGLKLGTTGSANAFGWTNVQAGAKALGSNVLSAFSGSGQTALGTTGTSGISTEQLFSGGEQMALGAGTSSATTGGDTLLSGLAEGAIGGGTGPMPVDETGFAGTAVSFIKKLVATAAEKQPALLLATMAGMGSAFLKGFMKDEELELGKKALEQKYTFAGFAPGGPTPDQMPADSPFWRGYNQNQASANQYVHGLRQPTMGRRTINYDYKPKGVVQQRTAQTLTNRPQGMINFNNPGVING